MGLHGPLDNGSVASRAGRLCQIHLGQISFSRLGVNFEASTRLNVLVALFGRGVHHFVG
jgi:hypothetical protein